ncbi:unnamed protein product [Spirodela intermedia]|uniref:MYND-type domain-containing protein n=1 Tax=Spirodela intermedia TaxID=51605 RepID=A0A7I8KJ67_SPIIN|nr:unnamed protein product [Spirodela intermedia]
MECAAKGRVTSRCTKMPATRRCPRCGAVAYCSISHQVSHWNYHKEECARLAQQMVHAKALNDLPFTFYERITLLVTKESLTKCHLLMSEGLHQKGLWKSECSCGPSVTSSHVSLINDEWYLPTSLCPCLEPKNPLLSHLRDWKDYYQWRCLPFNSPVALLLHSPLTVYHCFQLVSSSNTIPEVGENLHIHYLGPDRELLQLSMFGELRALFPGVHLHIEFIGPAVPDLRDNERISLNNYGRCSEEGCTCKTSLNTSLEGSSDVSYSVTLQLRKGFYHDRYSDIMKVSSPHIIIAPNAGVAAYSSWLPTIELIQHIGVPAVFSDFCEEAANLSASCIERVTKQALSLPVQVNPFRQPVPVENSALCIPCYSNCFLFGM